MTTKANDKKKSVQNLKKWISDGIRDKDPWASMVGNKKRPSIAPNPETPSNEKKWRESKEPWAHMGGKRRRKKSRKRRKSRKRKKSRKRRRRRR